MPCTLAESTTFLTAMVWNSGRAIDYFEPGVNDEEVAYEFWDKISENIEVRKYKVGQDMEDLRRQRDFMSDIWNRKQRLYMEPFHTWWGTRRRQGWNEVNGKNKRPIDSGCSTSRLLSITPRATMSCKSAIAWPPIVVQICTGLQTQAVSDSTVGRPV